MAKMTSRAGRLLLCILLLTLVQAPMAGAKDRQTQPGGDDSAQEGGAVAKLVFIHHSVGGNWLAHNYGGLVAELNRRGFYVNDITYGWQPPQLTDSGLKRAAGRLRDLFGLSTSEAVRIGDRTDIGQLYAWFRGPDADMIMAAVYRENNETANYGEHGNGISATPLTNPGTAIENEIVMIKPCYPNSLYRGHGNDAATAGPDPPRNFNAVSDQHTVANCKRIYNDILAYFASRPDKFFVIVTAPPRSELPENGAVARAFSDWLAHDWLAENDYRLGNVMVFDLFGTLTHQDGETNSGNLLVYPRKNGDNHPSSAGLRKATREFGPQFVAHYRQWKAPRK